MRLSTKGSVRTARTGVLLDGTHRGAGRREGPEDPPLLRCPLRCLKPLLHIDLLQPELDRPGDRALAAKHRLHEIARLETEGVPDVLREGHLALGSDLLHADRHGLTVVTVREGAPPVKRRWIACPPNTTVCRSSPQCRRRAVCAMEIGNSSNPPRVGVGDRRAPP